MVLLACWLLASLTSLSNKLLARQRTADPNKYLMMIHRLNSKAAVPKPRLAYFCPLSLNLPCRLSPTWSVLVSRHYKPNRSETQACGSVTASTGGVEIS